MSRTIQFPPHKDPHAIFARVRGPHDDYLLQRGLSAPSFEFKADDRSRAVSLELVGDRTIEIGSSSTVNTLELIAAYGRAHRFLSELLSTDVTVSGPSRYERLMADEQEAQP